MKDQKKIFLSFERPKERNKEKSPAGDTLPKNYFAMASAKISTSTFTDKLKVHRDKEIFADIAHNFLLQCITGGLFSKIKCFI
ncbi:MAG: hypothetical protein ABI840_08810 [bacterium]